VSRGDRGNSAVLVASGTRSQSTGGPEKCLPADGGVDGLDINYEALILVEGSTVAVLV